MKSDRYNLLEEEWIPVECRDGSHRFIAPWQISEGVTDGTGTCPLRIASIRPDFDGALIQFLIGLVQTVCPPQSDFEWIQWLKEPLPPETLREELFRFKHAFNVFGEPPLFMQDFDDLADGGVSPIPIERMLIEYPSGDALYASPGSLDFFCPSCLASALFCLQTECPDGGQGHRSGLRGGGPLTTIVECGLLWQTVVLNLTSSPEPASVDAAAEVFPWLCKTRTSSHGEVTTPNDVSPLQAFWAMPARIRVSAPPDMAIPCGLCGRHTERGARQWLKKNHGTNYPSSVWQHPLSPYHSRKRKDRKAGETVWERKPFTVPAGGLSYRDYLGLAVGVPDRMAGRFPARNTVNLRRHRRKLCHILGVDAVPLRAFGYTMKSMKARGRYDATVPFHLLDPRQRPFFDEAVKGAISLAEYCGGELERRTKPCLKSPKSKKKIPPDALASLLARFWKDGEGEFWEYLRRCVAEIGENSQPRVPIDSKTWWLAKTRARTLQVFDDAMQTTMLGRVNMRRVAEQRGGLRRDLYSGETYELLALPKKIAGKETQP